VTRPGDARTADRTGEGRRRRPLPAVSGSPGHSCWAPGRMSSRPARDRDVVDQSPSVTGTVRLTPTAHTAPRRGPESQRSRRTASPSAPFGAAPMQK
jgi:hypothetical protein